MPRFYRAAALAALVLSATAVEAQDQTVFRPDAAAFRYTEDQSLVELYLSFRAETLPYRPAENGFTAEVPAHIVVRPVSQAGPASAEQTPIFDETLPFAYTLSDTAMVQGGQVFVEQVRMAAEPGEYEVDVSLAPVGQSEVRALLNLTVPDFGDPSETAISSIQLASRIQPADDPTDPLAKSGLLIRPNPDAYYGPGPAGAVRYYAEVYDPPSGDAYTLLTFIAGSADGQALPDTQRRQDRPAREVDVIVGELDVSDLPSGIYFLRMVALDDANQALAEQSKRFFVINPDVEAPAVAGGQMTYEETLFAAMGEEELEMNVRHARVLANATEQAEIAAIVTDDDRRRFLTRFWANRDTDGLPSVNESRRRFYERLRTVDERYDEFGRESFETDRGRVYLKYGPPSEIDRRIFESDEYPHEVWTYDNIPGEGRSVFVFVARYSPDQFDLIHSDVTGEVSVPQWELEVIR